MQLTPQQTLERRVYRFFNKGITAYGLIEEDDHILIGLSGGKDSLALLELLSQRAQITHPRITVEALHVRMSNIDYKSDTHYLEQFAKKCGVTLHIRTGSFEADTNTKRTPCFLCSWNRRKILFETAQELECNKIALGHHMDDILHTMLLNQTFEGQFSTMPVLLRMKKFPITIIRPLCRVNEQDIIEFSIYHKYERQLKTCPFEHDSKRSEIKKIFSSLEELNPEVRYSLWKALEKENKLIEL
ncbi:MAG: tRNA 2-thiocytidine biosynthesis TtcA family protein [Bacteroidaceae bacterium]